MGIFDKFKIGFQKSASALTSGLKEIIVKKEIDDENLNKIEEFLIQSDVGVEAASEIKEIISFISEAASIPTSDWIKNSSILFKFSSSISFFTIISLRPDENAEALF